MRTSTFLAGMLLLMQLFGLNACTKKADGLPGPTGPAGGAGGGANNARSAITGYVRLTNQFGIPVSGSDGVKVSTTMGDSAVRVTTDASGKFILPAMRSGSYRILFQKDGYDSLAENVDHSAGGEDKFIGIVSMAGSLSTHIQDQTLELYHSQTTAGVQYLEVTTSIDGPPLSASAKRYFSIYISPSANVSDQDFIYQYQGSASDGGNQLVIDIYFNNSTVGNQQMHAGDSLYVKTCFVPDQDLQTSWFDPYTYQDIPYPYKGDSTIKSFIWAN